MTLSKRILLAIALLFSFILLSNAVIAVQQVDLVLNHWEFNNTQLLPKNNLSTLRIPSLLNCDTIDTDQNGNLFCGTDQNNSAGTTEWNASGTNVFLRRTTSLVGIGKILPNFKLDVAGTINASAYRGDGSLLTGLFGAGPWNSSGNNTFLNVTTGRVGIGTTNPSSALEVVGNITLTGAIITPANITIGPAALASGLESIAIGLNAQSNESGAGAIAIGVNSFVGAASSFALGPGTSAIGVGAAAIAFNANASGLNALALASGANAAGNNSLALQVAASSTGLGSQAIGFLASATNSFSQAIGSFSTSSGVFSTAIGFTANSANTLSIAIGGLAGATADNAIAIGGLAVASGTDSIALGAFSKANVTNSIAIGDTAIAAFSESVALGLNAATTAENQFMIGSSSDPLDTIIQGNFNVTGTSDNATFQGDVKIIGTLYGGSPLKIGDSINFTSDSTPEGNYIYNLLAINNTNLFSVGIGTTTRLKINTTQSGFFGNLINTDDLNGSSRFIEQNLNNGSAAVSAIIVKSNVGKTVELGIGSDGFVFAGQPFPNTPTLFSRTDQPFFFGNSFPVGWRWVADTVNSTTFNNTMSGIIAMQLSPEGNLNVSGNVTIEGTLILPNIIQLSPSQSTAVVRDDSSGVIGTKFGIRNTIASTDAQSGVSYILDVGSGNNMSLDLHSSLDPNNPLTVVSHYNNDVRGHVWRIEPTNSKAFFRWEVGKDNPVMIINNTGLVTFNGSLGVGTNTPSESLTVIGNASFAETWSASSTRFGNSNNARAQIINMVATATSPVFVAAGGDTDTGIGRQGANTMSLITMGKQRLFIDATGNVTMGTASNPANLTMFSPDGTDWRCGPNNSGAWTCS